MDVLMRRAMGTVWFLLVLLGVLLVVPSGAQLYVLGAVVLLAAFAYLHRAGRREATLLRQLESAGDLFSRHRLDGTFLQASSGFAAFFGVAPAHLAGRRELPGWQLDDPAALLAALQQVAAGDEPVTITVCLREEGGRAVWLEAVGRRVPAIAPRGVQEIVVVSRDVTARQNAEAARVASERRLRLITENMQEVLWLWVGREVQYVNEACERVTGLGRDLVRREGPAGWLPHTHPEDRERLARAIDAAVRHQAPLDEEFRLVRPDGQVRWLHARTVHVESGPDGRPWAVGVAADITHRRRAEETLRRSEERYRRLVEFLPDGVLVHDGRRVILGNRACANLFGTSEHELVGASLAALVPPESLAYLGLPAAGGERLVRGPDEVWLQRRDGARFPASVTSLPLVDRSGPAVLTVVKDLTRIRRFGEEIAAQQAILGALVETMPLGILAKDLDQDLRYVVWNAYMEAELGLPKSAVLSRRDADLFAPEFAAEMRRHDHLAAARGLPQDLGEVTLQLEDRTLDLHIVKVPVRDADGRVARVFSLVENVTRQKQLQARLQQASKMEAVGRLAGAVAHDFNNLLQVVQGYTEGIQEGLPRNGRLHEEAGHVLTAVGRARELVNRLLTYSRYDALKPEVVHIEDVVDQVLAMSRGVVPAAIELLVRRTDGLPAIYADPQLIEQALLNLVLNARDALPGEGRIEIETSLCELGREFCATRPWARPGRYVQVTVTDNGCGIPPDARDRVYEPFYTTKGFGQGTGLGLATTYSICKQHQGYIDFESEQDVGTSFHIFLPVLASEQVALPRPTELTPEMTGRGELILLVEDDDMVRSLTRQILERAGYLVLEARDGEDAMEVFMAHAAEIELLVLDVVMPRMDGRALYDNISELRPGVPVLFCSSYSADLLESEYMLQVGGSLLPKPYRAVELLRRVRALLDRTLDVAP